jgi:hypothetical protein
MASAHPRPRQVTIAGWTIVAGSVAVVLTVFQQIAGLHSLDTRESLQDLLGRPPFDGLGLSVDEMLSVIRVVSMVAAGCATATAILGWQALQRSRSARVALSILAPPLFVTGLSSGVVLSTAVAVAVGLLLLSPARDWFDGRWQPAADRPQPPTRPRPVADQRPAGRESAPAAPSQPPPYAAWPPPSQAWPPPQGSPSPSQQPFPHPHPYQPGAPAPSARATGRRPGAVVGAVVVTWVCSVLLGGLFVAGSLWLIGSPESLMDEMARQNPELVRDGAVTVGLVRATVAVMAGVVALWAIVACVTAFFVLRGAGWARVLLLISAAVAGAGLLVGSLVNPGLLVPLLGVATVFALLLRRDVVAWFRGRA